MEQASLHYCCDCKTTKPRDQFKSHEKDDKHGKKGIPTSKCTCCTMRNQHTHKKLKQKHDEDGPNPSEDPVEPDPVISTEEFTALLHEQAHNSNLCCQACVSTQGMDEEEEEVFKVIVRRIWHATGY